MSLVHILQINLLLVLSYCLGAAVELKYLE